MVTDIIPSIMFRADQICQNQAESWLRSIENVHGVSDAKAIIPFARRLTLLVQVENVEAKVGRKGFIKMKGSLPMDINKRKASTESRKGSHKRNQIALDINALEMRLRNFYTGCFYLQIPLLLPRLVSI